MAEYNEWCADGKAVRDESEARRIAREYIEVRGTNDAGERVWWREDVVTGDVTRGRE